MHWQGRQRPSRRINIHGSKVCAHPR
jgi:hypothetical protein